MGAFNVIDVSFSVSCFEH